jgi:hypothetical protein
MRRNTGLFTEYSWLDAWAIFGSILGTDVGMVSLAQPSDTAGKTRLDTCNAQLQRSFRDSRLTLNQEGWLTGSKTRLDTRLHAQV